MESPPNKRAVEKLRSIENSFGRVAEFMIIVILYIFLFGMVSPFNIFVVKIVVANASSSLKFPPSEKNDCDDYR